MKIELRHDVLAQKIYETASIEDKARAKALRFIQERYRHHLSDEAILLSDRELQAFAAYIPQLPLTASEQAFVRQSTQMNQKQHWRAKVRNYFTLALGCSVLFLGWGFWWRSTALKEERAANARLVELYQLSEDVRRVRSAADIEHVRTKAEHIVHQQLTDHKIKQVLQDAGVLKESESSHAGQHSQPVWQWAQLSGQVLSVQGQPVAMAKISLEGLHFQTDTAGRFAVPILLDVHAANEAIHLQVTKEGFAPLHYQLQTGHLPKEAMRLYLKNV